MKKDTAIAVYIDNSDELIREFYWLYRSWLLSGSVAGADIVAFIHPGIEGRKLPMSEGLVYVPLNPLTEVEPEWRDYPFINSTHFLTTPEASILTDYRYVLKSDCDCFLTRNFPKLKPRLATFGIGLFALVPKVTVRLADISARWGIPTVLNNVGSTFMAETNTALFYSQVHMEYCRRLKQEEFKDGNGEWPGWFFGVLTMYAGQLAANAVFGSGMVQGGLDVHSMAHSKISDTDYHIHAFHTYDDFSKFKWRRGEYAEVNLSELDPEMINQYCLSIAGVRP